MPLPALTRHLQLPSSHPPTPHRPLSPTQLRFRFPMGQPPQLQSPSKNRALKQQRAWNP
jgi:hypothetical protein